MTTKKFSSIRLLKPIQTKKRYYCMDVEGGSYGDNARVIHYPCHSGPNQKFAYNKKKKHLMVQSSRKCLDIHKNKIIQKTCNRKKKTQKWTRKKNKWMSLANKKCIGIPEENADIGQLVVQNCKK
jgi:hypothetical protein